MIFSVAELFNLGINKKNGTSSNNNNAIPFTLVIFQICIKFQQNIPSLGKQLYSLGSAKLFAVVEVKKQND